MMYFAGPANDSLSSKAMNDETMVSTVSPSITCPFLPPRHLSVSRVTVKQFCREERRFRARKIFSVILAKVEVNGKF